MKHIFAAGAISLSIVISLFSFNVANASILSKLNSKSFGGKILVTPIPGVICIGVGQAVYMNSNIGGAINAARSATSSASGGEKAMSILSGIYGMIPTYTTNPLRKPVISRFILGTEKLIPDFKTCKIGNIPIPVLRTTENYGISKPVKTPDVSTVPATDNPVVKDSIGNATNMNTTVEKVDGATITTTKWNYD